MIGLNKVFMVLGLASALSVLCLMAYMIAVPLMQYRALVCEHYFNWNMCRVTSDAPTSWVPA